MRALNRALNPETGILDELRHPARIKWQLRNETTAAVADQPADLARPAQAGLRPRTEVGRAGFVAPQLDLAAARLRGALLGGAGVSALQRQHGVPSVYNTLGRLGVTSEENDTLDLDEVALRRAFAEDLEGVRSLLADGDTGLVARLQAVAGDALRPRGGLLPLTRETLQRLRGRLPQERLGAAFSTLQGLQLTRRLAGALPPAS
jgi:hypothetical protein